MLSRLPLISSSLFCRGSLAVVWLFLAACQANTPPPMEASTPSTYVLVLVDTTDGEPAWLRQYRADLSPTTTLAVSGYTPNAGTQVQEQCLTLLSRVPWLLQPGVDTLYLGVGESCARAICDSLTSWSPSTYCVPRVGIK